MRASAWSDAPRSRPAPTVRSAMVVGTIHSAHLVQRDYPLARLAAVLSAAHPDLVLVEIRPEPFAAGHLEDGPFEMTYVTLLARAAGVPVEPIDWWREEDRRSRWSEPGARASHE